MNKIQNLPNRQERRKLAKDLGLFSKKKDTPETQESKERSNIRTKLHTKYDFISLTIW